MVRILFFCIQFVLFYLTIIFFIENKSILTLAPKIILINWLIAEILTQKFDLQLYQQKTKYIFSSFFNSYYILIFLNFIFFFFLILIMIFFG